MRLKNRLKEIDVMPSNKMLMVSEIYNELDKIGYFNAVKEG